MWPSTKVDLPPESEVDSLRVSPERVSEEAYISSGSRVPGAVEGLRRANTNRAAAKARTTAPAIAQGTMGAEDGSGGRARKTASPGLVTREAAFGSDAEGSRAMTDFTLTTSATLIRPRRLPLPAALCFRPPPAQS